MKYNYNADLSTSKSTLIFKLLGRWRGSMWQVVYKELLVWTLLYFVISLIYRLALNEYQQTEFERFVLFVDKRLRYIPLDFMLGFFVTTVVNRWITQFANLGMIDNIALFTSTFVKGKDEDGRKLRRNISRYCVLSQALVFRDIHVGVRKRFPTMESLVAAGFMLPHELDKFDSIKSRYAKYWLPFNWSLHLLNKARKEKRIDTDILKNTIAQEIRIFRSGLSLIWTYDWVPLPIMYAQLINLAVLVFFGTCLLCRQFIINDKAPNASEFDMYIPVMTILEFIFYVGWLKVAMGLLNPFGEDEDDFDCNFLLDRNLTIALTAVDEAHDDLPEVEPDIFYNTIVSPGYPKELAEKELNFYTGSATHGDIAPMKQFFDSISHLFNMAVTKEGVEEEDVPEIEFEMVTHPMNEKIDQYLQRTPRRSRGVSVLSVSPSERPRRMDSFLQHLRRSRRSNRSNVSRDQTRTSRSCTHSGAYTNPQVIEIEPEEVPTSSL